MESLRMPSKPGTFLAELKRRKVYHVAVAYVVVGFGVASGAEYIFEMLEFPPWAAQFVAILVILGFPIALVLAWAYEVKPEEPEVTEQTEATEEPLRGISPEVVRTSDEGIKSIVVLPFDNMSPDSSDAFFSDGLTEEITTNLSHVHSLRVISRTSAMAVKETQKNATAIAEELDVRYVLEGSVRKAGEKLRITAQLIDGRSDHHLWAETYDGVMEDVFAIQEQVSRSIAGSLKTALDPTEDKRLATRPVEDLGAYEFYLKAKHHIWQVTDDSLDEAMALLDRGLEIQPGSSTLLASKAFVNCQVLNAMGKSPGQYPALMREAQGWASEALLLDPESSITHWAQGAVFFFSGNSGPARSHWARAVELNPNHAEVLNWLGFSLLAGGCCPEKAKTLLRRAEQADPLNPLNAEVGPSYPFWFKGDFSAVLDCWKTWIDSESPLLRLYVGYFHAASGDMAGAMTYFERIVNDTPEHPAAAAGTFLGRALAGEADLALASVTKELEMAAWWDEFTPIVMADGYALIGEKERALHWVDRAMDMGTTNVAFLGEHEPFLRSLRGDPRFEALLEKAGRLSEALEEQVDSFRYLT